MAYKPIKFTYALPLCSDPKQYLAWRDAARMSRPHPKVGFCEDCTLEYQAQMIRERRCENPHVWFRVDEYGFVSGTNRIPEDHE